MTLSDKPAFLSAMKRLAAVYDKPLSDERITGYWDVLVSLPFDVVESAMREVAQSSQWFPAAAVVRQTAVALDERARAGSGPRWVYVNKATGAEYYDDPPVGDHSEFWVRRR